MLCASAFDSNDPMKSDEVAAGKRLLVVEDEFLVAAMLQEFLVNIGAIVIGPAHDVEHAMRLAQSEILDGAILDVNVRGVRIDPVAAILVHRNIPFALATGYSGDILRQWKDVPVLAKPYGEDEVAFILRKFVATE